MTDKPKILPLDYAPRRRKRSPIGRYVIAMWEFIVSVVVAALVSSVVTTTALFLLEVIGPRLAKPERGMYFLVAVWLVVFISLVGLFSSRQIRDLKTSGEAEV